MVRDAKVGNPTAKEVLKTIADQANDKGTSVWSSIAYFIFCTERSRSSVKRALTFLKNEDFIDHIGWSKYNTHMWRINIEKLEAVARKWENPEVLDLDDLDLGQNDLGGSERTEEGSSLDQGEGQSEPLTPIEPLEEPTYIDDVGGVPSELDMEWDNFLKGWATCFPEKTQPRPSNTSLKSKFATRMKNSQWRTQWRTALWTAKDWDWAQEEGWFKVDWVLKNNDNIAKILDGTFDFKRKTHREAKEAPRPQIVDARPKE
jgi:hypothetical protein